MLIDCRKFITKTLVDEKPHYVYELLYPDGFIDDDGKDLTGVIFYIGKGTSKKPSDQQRVDIHESQALSWYENYGWMEHSDRATHHKIQVIHKIWQRGMSVKKQIAFYSDNNNEVLNYEIAYIAQHTSPYLENGAYNKLNVHRWNSSVRNKVAHPRYSGKMVAQRKPDDVTLVDRFANELRDAIERGEYGKSGILPSMEELVSTWGVSNRLLVIEVITLLRSQGYIVQDAKRHYHAADPHLSLEGSAPNFRAHIESKSLKAEEHYIVSPHVETMSQDAAFMFCDDASAPAIEEGSLVIHRLIRQGFTDVPLRLDYVWYPLVLAEPYLYDMSEDIDFDFLTTLEHDTGVVVAREETSMQSRVPDPFETKVLRLARYQPILDVRQIYYTENGNVIALRRTISDATKFEYNVSLPFTGAWD